MNAKLVVGILMLMAVLFTGPVQAMCPPVADTGVVQMPQPDEKQVGGHVVLGVNVILPSQNGDSL